MGPPAVANFLRNTLGILLLDYRLSLWTLSLFLLALYLVTGREDLLNARIAVRRAVIYAGVVAVLTFAAVALITFRPYAVAALLLLAPGYLQAQDGGVELTSSGLTLPSLYWER